MKLRIDIADGSFIDIFLSQSGRYSYHWERRLIGIDELYRHDNAPHVKWLKIDTFPKHFHNGHKENVEASSLSAEPIAALSEFLTFVRKKLLTETCR